MKEEFASYSQAVALYNLDFDWDCGMAYFDRPWNHEHRLVPYTIAAKEQRDYDGTDVYPAPTLALAQKWLREVKGMDIYVIPRFQNAYEVAAKRLGKAANDTIFVFDLWDSTKPYPTYESALSAGLDASLELIKQK